MKYTNNPFNIRATNSKWLGLTGKVNGFCTFDSVPYSVRVFLYLVLKTYKKRKSDYTLADFVHFYCPNGDGNNNESVYLDFILSRFSNHGFFMSASCTPGYFTKKELYCLASAVCLMESSYVLSFNDFRLGYHLFYT